MKNKENIEKEIIELENIINDSFIKRVKLKEELKCLIENEESVKNTTETILKRKVFDFQEENIIASIINNENIIIKRSEIDSERIRIFIAAIIASILFNSNKKEIIIIMNKDLGKSKKLLNLVKKLLLKLYKHENFSLLKETSKEFILPNGSQIKATVQCKCALCGYSPTFFIGEDCFNEENSKDVYYAAISSLTPLYGKYILIGSSGFFLENENLIEI